MNDYKPSFYAILPASVRYDNSLSSSEKLFYAEVTAMSKQEGYCWASNTYFAKIFEVAPSTVSSWVSGLKSKGHVALRYHRSESGNVEKRLIYPIQKTEYPYSENGNPPIQNSVPPYSENQKYNSTSNNNTRTNNTSIESEEEKSESVKIAERVADKLLKEIVKYDPDHKYSKNPPSTGRWVKDIEKAVRIDGRTEKQLVFMIEYLFRRNTRTANFWRPNIQSGEKVRDKFDKIKEQIRQEQKPNNRTNGKRQKGTKEHARSLSDKFEKAWQG